MYATAVETVPARAHRDASAADRGNGLLAIEPGEFAACFDRRPFLVGHSLAGHPLFELPRLVELARTLPADQVEYNAGDIPVSMDPKLTPRNGLTPDETIVRIAECKSWLVLKYVERDAQYRGLLEHCLAELRLHSERLRPGMLDGQGFVFVSSPGSITPYHMDPEHNFLLQIRGSKEVHLFDPRDSGVLAPEELERFYGGGHRNMPYREEYEERALRYELAPGQGLHFPVTAPHYVRNGQEVSISFSITFRTPDLESRARTHIFNGWLRRHGIKPAPVGRYPRRDSLKSLAWRVSRRVARVLPV